jgi:hypothetical protein
LAGGIPKQTLAAYDPATDEQVWSAETPGTTNAGNFVIAGDVVIQPGGQALYAFDARSGKQLFSLKAPATIRATPITYQVNRKQYVTVMRVLCDLLYDVPPFDPIAVGGAVVILVAAVAIALLIPVRRATRVDPILALRAE